MKFSSVVVGERGRGQGARGRVHSEDGRGRAVTSTIAVVVLSQVLKQKG